MTSQTNVTRPKYFYSLHDVSTPRRFATYSTKYYYGAPAITGGNVINLSPSSSHQPKVAHGEPVDEPFQNSNFYAAPPKFQLLCRSSHVSPATHLVFSFSIYEMTVATALTVGELDRDSQTQLSRHRPTATRDQSQTSKPESTSFHPGGCGAPRSHPHPKPTDRKAKSRSARGRATEPTPQKHKNYRIRRTETTTTTTRPHRGAH